MWGWLKTLRKEGFHFRRQAPYRGYYLDFVCLNRMLVIELDGPSHGTDESREYDAARDHALMRLGFRVLRFQNRTIDQHMPSVVDAIYEALSLRPSRREPTSPPDAQRASALPNSGRDGLRPD